TPSTYAVSPGSVSDITPPVTTYSASGSSGVNSWYTSSVTVTLSATDDSSGLAAIHFRTDGGAWQAYASPFTSPSAGSHTIEYYGTDVAGNLETAKSSVVRISGSSFGPPVTVLQVTGTAGMNGWYISFVNVTLTATSPSGTGVFTMYSVDGTGWTQYAQTFMLPEGSHSLDYQSWDSAGFVEPRATTSIDVDLTPPTLGGSPSGFQTLPLVLPAIALGLLLFAVVFWRRRLRRHEDEDRGDYYDPDEYPEEYDSSDL